MGALRRRLIIEGNRAGKGKRVFLSQSNIPVAMKKYTRNGTDACDRQERSAVVHQKI